ncbi:LysR family transcriptional regulator [Vibrio vulnificus]|nr:LysR family transcriptional regulator [Vibrio vulnificus]EJN6713311.1 LysR family transcriptional regulator [Vibrio vulnificus]MCU8269137.1 LysR family transcriptional regulator [Vibrio vulnificus]
MDYKLFQTFIAVSKHKHFGRAAESLHLTQAAVSSRIKLLEQYYNKTLFHRGTGQVKLTPAGELLYGFAARVIAILEETKRELQIDEHDDHDLEIAIAPNVLHTMLHEKITLLSEELSSKKTSVNILNHAQMRKGLILNTLSIVFSFNRVFHDDFFCKKISKVTLALVSTSSDFLSKRFVDIDWGEHFYVDFTKRHPSLSPIFRTDSGFLGLKFILERGGCAYLPEKMIQPYLQGKILHKVLDVPEFSYFIYVGYNKKLLSSRVEEQLLHLLDK